MSQHRCSKVANKQDAAITPILISDFHLCWKAVNRPRRPNPGFSIGGIVTYLQVLTAIQVIIVRIFKLGLCLVDLFSVDYHTV